jgi:hypothetical protein
MIVLLTLDCILYCILGGVNFLIVWVFNIYQLNLYWQKNYSFFGLKKLLDVKHENKETRL